jgi:predicted lipoprotein with Yx(FWY)xxD motif
MTRKTLTAALFPALLAVILIVVFVGGGSAKTQPKRSHASVLSVRRTSLGKVLVGATGHTLYLFERDRRNHSSLSAAGRKVWPPFTVKNAPKAQNGAQSGKIGTIAAASGGRQVTYGGHPLYYFVGDTKAGATQGQGLNAFGGRWYVLTPSGSAIKTSVATSPPATPAPSGYGSTTPTTSAPATTTSSPAGGGYGD